MAKARSFQKSASPSKKRSASSGSSSVKREEGSSRLSSQQLRVFQFLKESFYQSGSMPTLREICHYMGWSAVGSAQSVIHALIQKGYLRRHPLKARGLQLADSEDFRVVPILGSAPAGHPVEAVEYHEGDISIPHFIRGPVFAIRVSGDSMQGADILDGDIAIVKQTETAQTGDIVVALIQGDVTIKRLIKKGRALILRPENASYTDIKVEDPAFRILGKVIGLHRYWESL